MPHGGDLIARMLARYGVQDVFGQPGGQTAALYDGYAGVPAIRHTLVRDERSAAYAADAYARLTGKPGVCDVTVGPGTTKLGDGLMESLNASIPVVAIVGELPRDWETLKDKGVASQGMDQVAFLKTITKATWSTPSLAALPHVVRAAFRTATSGRPGPVAVIVPHDVIDAEWEPEDLEADDRHTHVPAFRTLPEASDLQAAADLLAWAARPVVIAGGGGHVSGATAELAAFAEATGAVVVTSFSGKGAVAETAAYAGGVLNPLAGPTAATLVKQADLLMWVGAKSSQNTSLNWTIPAPDQATIHLDSDAVELGRTFRPTVALCGDAKATLAALLEHVTHRTLPDWAETVARVKAEGEAVRAAEAASDASPLAPQRVMRDLAARLAPTDVVISDASFTAGWVSAFVPAQAAGRNFLFARGQGSLGYSVPAAIGAATARPDDRVVTVSGDGGFYYAIGELATHAQYGLRTINVVLNNGTLGWLQMWQDIFFDGTRYSVDLENPDSRPGFAAAAEAMGCVGLRAETPAALEAAFDEAFAAERPVVIDVRIDPDATPLHSFRRRRDQRAQGRTFARPGATYEVRRWVRSPGP